MANELMQSLYALFEKQVDTAGWFKKPRALNRSRYMRRRGEDPPSEWRSQVVAGMSCCHNPRGTRTGPADRALAN